MVRWETRGGQSRGDYLDIVVNGLLMEEESHRCCVPFVIRALFSKQRHAVLAYLVCFWNSCRCVFSFAI